MIEIDGKTAHATGTVLEACRAVGANVPAFCDDAEKGGHCRACLVEIDGKVRASCTTDAQEGMRVRTGTDTLRGYRKHLLELMAQEATPRDAFADACGAWNADVSCSEATATPAYSKDHPYLRVDLSACILCRRCMHACDEVQGQFVFAVEGRGHESTLRWGNGFLMDTPCVSCGACVSACPTGAISDVDRERFEEVENDVDERLTTTTCGYCGVGCQLDVTHNHEEILFIDGASSPVNRGHLCAKGRYAHRFVRHPDRLRTPLLRKNGSLEPVGWSEAIDYVARELDRLRGHLAGLSSSRCTNEENYLFQKWFRAELGTHNIDCCARVCHAPTATGMKQSFGTGAATNSLADVELCDLILVAGSNATESHPVTGARLKQRVLSGVPLIVIDPRKTELARLADVHLMLRPGTNVPLLNSLANVLVKEGLVDRLFIEARTEGFEEHRSFIEDFSPEETESVTGVAAADVRRAARLYGSASSPLQVHGLGMTEHLQGSESVSLLCNLALLCGAIGRPGVGVNPLRGQNNVQGAADMGCQPDSMTGYADPTDPAVRSYFEAVWGRELPVEPGLTLPKMYDAVRAGDVRGLFILGEDVVQTDPDASRVKETLSQLELLVVQEIFPSETSALAHVVLPGASFLEKDGTFTNGERRIQLVRRVLEPLEGTKPDWQILCELMKATGYPQRFDSPDDIMKEISAVSPKFKGVGYDRLEGAGLQWPVLDETHPGTQVLHVDTFPKGRAPLVRVPYVPSPAFASAAAKPRSLLLVTGRVLAHYNTGSMTRRTDNVRLQGGDLLEIHADDAAERGIDEGIAVTVESEFGTAEARAHISDRIAPGTAFLSFHFPETGTNRVTSDVLDRLADCPEYKVTAVTVAPA